jgi:Putative MetA-pathway of phenol degradation
MLQRFIVLLCMAGACGLAQAQIKKKIKKGRRNTSQSQFALDKNYLQAEWELGHETITDELSTTVYPNLLLRYGITKRLEVNTEINIITATDKQARPKNTSGTEPVLLGINYLLHAETKKGPAVIFSAQVAVPFLAGKNFTATYWAPLLQLGVQKPVSKKLTPAVSAGVFWDGFLPSPFFIYNAGSTYNAGKKITVTAELSGFINSSPPQHNADVGITYTINKKLQLGATAGIGISAAAHKNYVAINGVWGISLRRQKK